TVAGYTLGASMASEQAQTLDPLVGRPAAEAVPELLEALGGKVLTLGLKFCGNREDAEDLLQETFLQAYRKWDQFEGRAAPASWLYSIAARGCQRLRRRRAGEPARFDSLDEPLPSGLALVTRLPAAEAGPLDEELRKEVVQIVDRALERLPPDYRLPLVLKEIAELSLGEIAEILGVKEATVKTRVHRGRLALRSALAGGLSEQGDSRADHPRQICLDLLQAKMEAMDRGTAFPMRGEDLCERCRTFIDTLDLAAEACRWLHGGELSEALRGRLMAEFERQQAS
ncbi:MAG: sigma-70 family RNA polymerase sigma factor, partial [Acidobacteriota bacterium]|nr:sigma-70 family RNA polymerase sigma factor [Acidobacteriota bacterium]